MDFNYIEFYRTVFEFSYIFDTDVNINTTQSPIEEAFLGYWLLQFGIQNIHFQNNIISLINQNIYKSEDFEYCSNDDLCYKIIPQYEINNKHPDKKYYIDFCLFCKTYSTMDIEERIFYIEKENEKLEYLNIKEFKVFVELDGHNFHEKTKDQVIERNKRDQFLQRLGFIYHISGSELYRDFDDCISDLKSFIYGIAKGENSGKKIL